MKRSVVKRKGNKQYRHIEFDKESALKAREEIQSRRKKKKPTSVALDDETIELLKSIAQARGIPYQVLMRSYILQGLNEELKKVG